MNKDVIYIDVEDDITTIVGKIKDSKEKIIALVPPKRVGVLQSAVNMRLLERTATLAKKRIVLVTNDSALAGLAAVAHIPVSRSLQSKPEIAEIPALKVDNDDDIIDGRQLTSDEPVDLDKKSGASAAVKKLGAASILAGEKTQKTEDAEAADEAATDETPKKKVTKVPDFNIFRKRFLLIGCGVGLLVAFFVWAIWFAPRATVIISAKSSTVTVSETVSLTTDGATNPQKNSVKALRREQSSDVSVEFNATGKKKVGEKATGRVQFSTDSITLLGKTVPAGTVLQSSSGAQYVTDSAATFSLSNYRGVTVGVTAAEIGESYNGASGSVSGAPRGISARFVDSTSGGSSREVTVVSESDVSQAAEKLADKKDENARQKLLDGFGSSAVIIEDSYQEKRSDPTPSVQVGQEATSPVTLKSTITTSVMAVDKTDIAQFIDEKIKEEISGKASQKVYKNGVDDAKLTQFNSSSPSVNIATNAVVGPAIDEEQVKEQVRGMTYGDVQAKIEAIPGVDSVDVQFSPFWVHSVPEDTARITIKFDMIDGSK